jgi:hypothetical protein
MPLLLKVIDHQLTIEILDSALTHDLHRIVAMNLPPTAAALALSCTLQRATALKLSEPKPHVALL